MTHCTHCHDKPTSRFSPFLCDECLLAEAAGSPIQAAALGKPLPSDFNFEHEYYELLDKVVKMRQRLINERDHLETQINDSNFQYKNSARGKQKTINRVISDFNFLISKNRKAIEARYGALQR